MSNAKKNVAVILFSVIAGCVPSLHELYTEDSVVFDSKLVGCWETGPEEQWCFTRHKNWDGYDLIITAKEEEQEKRSVLLARLVDLEGQRFLDLYPDEDVELCTGDWYKFHMLPVHTFMKVYQTEPNLVVMAAMRPNKVKDLLKEKPKLIKHEIVEDRVVLTADPLKLQAFVTDPAIAEEIFDDDFAALTRYKPEED